MRFDIEAIAFDIDGTLYPSWKLNLRIIPFMIKHRKLMSAFSKTRKEIRKWQKENPEKVRDDFFDFQANILSEFTNKDAQRVKKFLDEEIYFGWKKIFKKIKPYPFVKEVITQLKKQGLKIGILSDFPPEQKNDIWGILPLCNVAIGSEEIGGLKPSIHVFKILADKLEVSPEKILYVGNNFEYDIVGANQAGMKTAYIQFSLFSLINNLKKNAKTQGADINFSNYKQLLKFIND